tara:strand:- start:301 stop:492 length:192 start_codon:yes stop_codon:yes gene_type:complete
MKYFVILEQEKLDKGAGIGQMKILNKTRQYKNLIGVVCPCRVSIKCIMVSSRLSVKYKIKRKI